MMIYNVSVAICQLGNFCFECMTLYTHGLSSILVYCLLAMGMGMGGNGNRDVGEYGNENEVLDGEWECDGNVNTSAGMVENGSHSRTPVIYY